MHQSRSPLLIAKLADKCAQWSKPVTLKLINIEAKKSHYQLLCAATQPWVEKGVVTNKRGQFGALVSEVLKEIGTAPTLFFIDPYGPTEVPFAALQQIISRDVPATELIINFNVNGLRRLADCLHAKEGEKQSQER